MVKPRLTCLIYYINERGKVGPRPVIHKSPIEVSGQTDTEILANVSVIHVMNRKVLTFSMFVNLDSMSYVILYCHTDNTKAFFRPYQCQADPSSFERRWLQLT